MRDLDKLNKIIDEKEEKQEFSGVVLINEKGKRYSEKLVDMQIEVGV